MRIDSAKSCDSPWFCPDFLHAMERGGAQTLNVASGNVFIAGIERRAKFGQRLLQVGSHFGEGLIVKGDTVDLLRTLRSVAWNGIDAISIISPARLEELDAYQTENSTGTILLELTADEAELWMGIRKSFKGCINQGRKKGNTICWNERRDIHEIEMLYRQHVVAKGYGGIEWEVINGLHDVTGGLFRLDLGLVRSPQGQPAAMAAILVCGETATYFVGGSSPDNLTSYPGHFLHWNAILRYKEMGCTKYDFGGATEDQNKATYEITKFKRGFGGEYVKFYTYNIPLSYRYAAYQQAVRLVRVFFPRRSK